jgi:hypothetical protein
MHKLSHIDKDISLGYDTTGKIITSTICQMLMDEVDVEGKPIFHVIERKIHTNRALFLEPNNDLCMMILDDSESWMAQKVNILTILKLILKTNMSKCLLQPSNRARVNNMFNLALMQNL